MSEYAFGDTWGPVMLVVVPLVVVAMVAGPWARNLGADLRTWTLAYPAYLAAVLDPFTSIFRYLIPLFPLLVVVLGAGLGRPSRQHVEAAAVAVRPARSCSFVVGQYYWTDILWRVRPPERLPAVTRHRSDPAVLGGSTGR